MIPVSEIDIEPFYPQIMEEVAQEFAHQDDGRTHRDTREYGYSFFKMERGDFSYTPPPAFLQEIGSKICEAFGHEPVAFTNVILSLYEEGFHLEPHVDVNIEDSYGFYFSENVYGLIVEPDATGHLFFSRYDGAESFPLYSLEEQAGTIFCLQGDYRKSPIYHSVTPVTKRRISLTFRTVEILPQLPPFAAIGMGELEE